MSGQLGVRTTQDKEHLDKQSGWGTLGVNLQSLCSLLHTPCDCQDGISKEYVPHPPPRQPHSLFRYSQLPSA